MRTVPVLPLAASASISAKRRSAAQGSRAGLGAVQARRDALHEALLGAPDARLAQRQRQRLAGVQRGAHAGQRAGVLGQVPVHQHGGLAFGLQAVEHAQQPRHVAGQHGLAELEDVEARHVQHGGLDVRERQLALGVQQRELLQLLVGGQQVAFHAVGEEGQRALAVLALGHRLALRLQALRQPGRQRAALDGLHA